MSQTTRCRLLRLCLRHDDNAFIDNRLPSAITHSSPPDVTHTSLARSAEAHAFDRRVLSAREQRCAACAGARIEAESRCAPRSAEGAKMPAELCASARLTGFETICPPPPAPMRTRARHARLMIFFARHPMPCQCRTRHEMNDAQMPPEKRC